MSRYGRSQYHGSKGLREVNVQPRNDRFFLGSRYGKRSEELNPDTLEGDLASTYDAEQQPSQQPQSRPLLQQLMQSSFQQQQQLMNNGPTLRVSCTYTGVTNLYRCNNNG